MRAPAPSCTASRRHFYISSIYMAPVRAHMSACALHKKRMRRGPPPPASDGCATSLVSSSARAWVTLGVSGPAQGAPEHQCVPRTKNDGGTERGPRSEGGTPGNECTSSMPTPLKFKARTYACAPCLTRVRLPRSGRCPRGEGTAAWPRALSHSLSRLSLDTVGRKKNARDNKTRKQNLGDGRKGSTH